MLVIRFFRLSKKNQPSFKIVVADKRNSSTRGRFVEEIGHFNPLTKEKILNAERIKYWLSVGAQPSPTVFNLLVSEKIIEGKKKIDVHKKAKAKEAASAPAAAPASQGQKPTEGVATVPTAAVKPVAAPAETVPAKEELKPAGKPAETSTEKPADLSVEASAKAETPAKTEQPPAA